MKIFIATITKILENLENGQQSQVTHITVELGIKHGDMKGFKPAYLK